MKRMFVGIGKALVWSGRMMGVAGRATIALVGVCGVVAALANYTMTQGAGTNFGSIVVGGVHYAQQLLCDPATPANCSAVKVGNTATTTDVAQVVTDPNVLAAVNGPMPLLVNGAAQGATGLTPGVAQTGTIVAMNADLTSVGGTAVLRGTGAVGTGSSRVAVGQDTTTIAGSAPGTAGAPSTNVISIQGVASGTVVPINNAQISGAAMSVSTGGTDAGTQRTVQASATPATPVAATASDNHATLKNGAGVAMSVHTSNNSSTKNYLRLYDAGTGFNGCNSATGVIFAMEIPPNDGGFSVSLGGGAGIAFTNGLSWCITSGFGLTDTTNATASAIYANASYR